MLFKRILIVLVVAPFLLGLLFYSPPQVFKGLVLLCTAVGLWEFFQIVAYAKRQLILCITLGILHGFFLLFVPANMEYFMIEQTGILLFLFVLFVFLSSKHMEGSFSQLSFSLLGIFYVATLAPFVGLIRDFSDGAGWVFLLLAMTWMNDTAAYFFGHYLGRRKLAPQLSPGKTVEGFLGGFVGTAVAYFATVPFLHPKLTVGQGLILIALLGSFGPLGDLSESLMKRHFGIKDSGKIIPGHGGMLDRIDALLFTGPVFYVFIKYFIL